MQEDKVNITPPGEEWKNKVQIFAMDLIEIRFKIDEGNLQLLPTYQNKLKAGLRILGIYTRKDIKEKLDKIKNITGYANQFNPLTGESSLTKTEDYETYLSELDELDTIVREGLRKDNYLVKTTEKRVRLT